MGDTLTYSQTVVTNIIEVTVYEFDTLVTQNRSSGLSENVNHGPFFIEGSSTVLILLISGFLECV